MEIKWVQTNMRQIVGDTFLTACGGIGPLN